MSIDENTLIGGWSAFSEPGSEERKFLAGDVVPGAKHLKPLLISMRPVSSISYLVVANDGVQAVQGNQPFPVLVKVSAEFGGDPVITQLREFGHPGHVGSYGPFQGIETEADEVTAAKAALKEAMERHVGIRFTALFVSTQTVAARNYLFAGNITPSTRMPHTYPAFITVYKPVEGKARITSIERAWEL